MATETKTGSARNDTGTARTPGAWVDQVSAQERADRDMGDAEVTGVDTEGSAKTDETERRVMETEPTYTDLFNYYTKLDRPEAR